MSGARRGTGDEPGASGGAGGGNIDMTHSSALGPNGDDIYAHIALEPFTYSEDFESGELNGWASYPLWQDTAFDPWIRPNRIVPGDPNVSIEQTFPAFWHEDTYAGAQKLLDMYLAPGSSISLRYYIESHIPAEFVRIRLAAGSDGRLDYTLQRPAFNRWEWMTVAFDDLARENPGIAGKSRIRLNALAVLVKIPRADPKMKYFLGLDDVLVRGARAVAFRFAEPKVCKLSEWKPYIPRNHYHRGDTFRLQGRWPLEAERVEVRIASFAERNQIFLTADLEKRGDTWSLRPFELSFPEGLYLGTLTAQKEGRTASDAEFTLYIAPQDTGGRHPRLWFDSEKKKQVQERLRSDKFLSVAESLASRAKAAREKLPLEEVVFDIDQLPDENILEGHIYMIWMERIARWQEAVSSNALLYSLFGDQEAGDYSKNALLKVCRFPYWLNPWFRKRGQHTYYPITSGGDFALGYDLLYELMDEAERKTVRQGLMQNDVMGCHRGYVEANLVTSNTSNWVAAITGGSLMSQAAIYGDGSDVAQAEPYFTGALLKLDAMIRRSIDPDGAYGEGGYISSSMHTWNLFLPVIEGVFKVDLSRSIPGIYQEAIWSGIVREKLLFQFGDPGGSGTNGPWLLSKYHDPLLGWAYPHFKDGETLMDVLYDNENAPRKEPYDQNPVRVFRNVGTTVFKSGWEKDDFVFVMRTGAFYNHQHLDQGSFWLADRGSVFLGERKGSHYWYYSQDPLFLSWFIQPVNHSTILIDNNPQSQRTGDPLAFAEGFEDRASIHHFLDGADAAFSSGDIGRLYWGKVRSMRRNVLYLKPRTLLMLDTVEPAAHDVEVKLLYQAFSLKDIKSGDRASTVAKDGNLLHILHLHPERPDIQAEEVPHYIFTLKNGRPLEREGMLTVSARTDRRPLVVANLLTTTRGEQPDVITAQGEGYISGTANGTPFAFATMPDSLYVADGYNTDALALTWSDRGLFAALCTWLEKDGRLLLSSDEPITCEIGRNYWKYYHTTTGEITLGVASKPASITVNGQQTSSFRYDSRRKAIVAVLPAGEGMVSAEASA